MTTYIAGPRHHDGALQIIARLRGGDELALEREPDNPHDRNAVAVRDLRTLRKLGYVPRADAPAVAKAMDSGYTVRAVLGRDGQPSIVITWERVQDQEVRP